MRGDSPNYVFKGPATRCDEMEQFAAILGF